MVYDISHTEWLLDIFNFPFMRPSGLCICCKRGLCLHVYRLWYISFLCLPIDHLIANNVYDILFRSTKVSLEEGINKKKTPSEALFHRLTTFYSMFTINMLYALHNKIGIFLLIWCKSCLTWSTRWPHAVVLLLKSFRLLSRFIYQISIIVWINLSLSTIFSQSLPK